MGLPLRQLSESLEPHWKCDERLLAKLESLCPKYVSDTLAAVSQWGLKEVWLGRPIKDHDRWHHSKGVLAVTALWLSHLYGGDRVRWRPWPLQSYDGAILLAGMAALVHDLGHLPFAHLLAEVLESINWVPKTAGHAGMEGFVLKKRLEQSDFGETWDKMAGALGLPDKLPKLSGKMKNLAKSAVQDLIIGRFGVPWVQAILNSAVDADKIDYLHRDSHFLSTAGWPVAARLPTEWRRWLEEFLSDQHVNDSGLLCLNGRSAVAAADLLRERIFLHDRFYLSPQIRVPERMAFEIVQQFLIRAVMSDRFRKERIEAQIGAGGNVGGYSQRCRAGKPVDPIEIKGRLVAELLEPLADTKATSSYREFELLRWMWEQLKDNRSIDADYLELVKYCFDSLEKLKPPGGSVQGRPLDLVDLVKKTLVREPLVFRREDYAAARDALRPVQHTYHREVLIDIAKLPRVLGMPARWRGSATRQERECVDYGILVPEGPVSAWGPGSSARVPLTDRAVSQLERPYGRVLVIARAGQSPRAEYIWDRVRSVLLEAGVRLQARSRAEVG